LEAAIMSVLWDAPHELTAQQIRAKFDEPLPAITTVITVLDRLRHKGLVARSATAGQSYVFHATRSRDDDIAATMTAALELSPDRALALMRFAGSLTDSDREFLRRAITNANE
jgi:predicted transcriptional regulator